MIYSLDYACRSDRHSASHGFLVPEPGSEIYLQLFRTYRLEHGSYLSCMLCVHSVQGTYHVVSQMRVYRNYLSDPFPFLEKIEYKAAACLLLAPVFLGNAHDPVAADTEPVDG